MNLRTPALALLLASAAAQPAQAEVVAKADNGFVVRVAAHVTAKPAAAWKTVIVPAQWWQAQHTFSGSAANLSLDPVPGGCFCERLPLPKDAAKGDRPGGVQHMRVLYAEPGKALRLSGALGPLQSEAVQGTLTITIKPTETGSRIVFDYVVGGFMRYPVADIAAAVDKVMAAQLASLATRLGPVSAEPAAELPPATPAQPAPEATGPAPSPGEGSDPALAPTAAVAPQGWSLPPGPGSKPVRHSAATPAAAARSVEPATRPAKASGGTTTLADANAATVPASVSKLPAVTKPAAAKPATAKPAAPKPASPKPATPAKATAARKPAPAARPVDKEHEDANAAFDAALGGTDTPDKPQ